MVFVGFVFSTLIRWFWGFFEGLDLGVLYGRARLGHILVGFFGLWRWF